MKNHVSSTPAAWVGISDDLVVPDYSHTTPLTNDTIVNQPSTTSFISGLPQDAYELDLIRHYRYHVSHRIDTDTVHSHFGVDSMRDNNNADALSQAILAVAASHRAATLINYHHEDSLFSSMSAQRAHCTLQGLDASSALTAKLLLLSRSFILSEPSAWHICLSSSGIPSVSSTQPAECRSMIRRMAMASIFFAPPESSLLDLWNLLPKTGLQAGLTGGDGQHFDEALSLLEHSARFLHIDTRPALGFVPQWQSCWQACGSWFTTRPQSMQDFFSTSTSEDLRNSIEHEFPTILFPTSVATIANMMYHTAAIILLSTKPRFADMSGTTTAVRSIVWHIQRCLGIAISASGHDLWDPLSSAIITFVSQRLSARTQMDQVTALLERVASASGLQLRGAVAELKALMTISED